jgi:hypothetical protein
MLSQTHFPQSVSVNPVKITTLTLNPSNATILIAKGEALGKQIFGQSMKIIAIPFS